MRPRASLAVAVIALTACRFSDAGLGVVDDAGDAQTRDAQLDAQRDAAPDAALCGALGQRCCAASRCAGDLSCAGDRCVCVSKLALGATHTCALSGGKALCWGGNASGQVGDGMMANRALPFQLPSLSDLADISAGYSHTCAVRRDGTVWCWGQNSWGELGNGNTNPGLVPVPVQLPTGVSAVAVAAGNEFTCALSQDPAVFCWGANGFGQLGQGSTDMLPHPVPMLVSVTGAAELSTGTYHACARTAVGGIVCWGLDNYGQIGGTVESTGMLPRAVALPAGHHARTIVAAYAHTCAVGDDGQVYCWGLDNWGQLGDGLMDTLRHATPARALLPAGEMAASVSGSLAHTCAVTSDGRIYCWGYDAYGQLGSGPMGPSPIPLRVTALPTGVRAGQVATGYLHSCTRMSDATVRCWGDAQYGELGVAMPSGATLLPTPAALTCNRASVGDQLLESPQVLALLEVGAVHDLAQGGRQVELEERVVQGVGAPLGRDQGEQRFAGAAAVKGGAEPREQRAAALDHV
jgi:alpha-tubulin suppressor-like RCC1 family protein